MIDFWKQDKTPVGRVALNPTSAYMINKNLLTKQKHYNLPYFSQKLFFNVKISKKLQGYNS